MRIISWTVSQSPPLQYIEVYVNDIEGIKGMGVIFPFRPTHAGLRMLACVIPGPESALSLSQLTLNAGPGQSTQSLSTHPDTRHTQVTQGPEHWLLF